MKVLLTFILLLAPGVASAQWIDYPTPGVPKSADGSPNLNAPAPRTPDVGGTARTEDVGAAIAERVSASR